MCSLEGDWITAKKDDGASVIVKWWDFGDIEGYWATVLKAEDWSEVSLTPIRPGADVNDRLFNDQAVLTRRGIDIETLEFHMPRFDHR